MERRQLVNSMKIAEDNMAWLHDHFQELLGKYAGAWVAVHQKRVVDSDPEREALINRLKSMHSDFQVYAVQLITEDIDLIL